MVEIEVTATATVPSGTTVELTVYEDVGDDGSGSATTPWGVPYDNVNSTTLTDGTTTTFLSGYDGGTGNAYYVDVTALDGGVTQSPELDVDALTVNTDPLAPPTNVSATASGDNITLSWDDVAREDGYYVYRAQTTGSTTDNYTQVADLSADTTSYTDTALLDGERYYYRVSSYKTGGIEGLSIEVTATTALPAPTNLNVAKYNDNTYELVWTSNANHGTEAVQVSTDDGSTWSNSTTGLATDTETATTGVLSTADKHKLRIKISTEHATSYSPVIEDWLAGDTFRFIEGAVETDSTGAMLTRK